MVRAAWMAAIGASVALQSSAADPARVVSLAPNLTQIVLSLGRGEQLTAVTPFCEAPAGITRLPGGIQPEAESVLGLEPDLVLATSMTPSATREQLVRMGIRIEVIDAPSLDGIREAVTKIATLLGAPQPNIPAPAAVTQQKSVALLFGADTGYSAGCGTHAHEILEAAGLRNIAADAGGPWPQIGEEFLLAADPDVIIVADYANADRESVINTLRRHPVRQHLTAVRTGRVIVFPAPAFSVPGPEALQAGDSLRAEVAKL
jgi:iron complex transport system substrate-binding protein